MSNLLYHNSYSHFSNSEYYRYMKAREASLSKDQSEQLLTLIAKNDLAHQLENYLKQGLNPNFRFQQGNTLIHTMAQYNALDCVKLLVKRGVDYNCLSSYGSTPLENAMVYDAEEVVMYLKSIGAKAHVITLRELINRSNIAREDKIYIFDGINFNEDLTDIIVNISAFAEQILLAKLNGETLPKYFFQGMKILMEDHYQKLETLKEYREKMNYGVINNALLKYDLTAQQSIIFRQLYLNQDLIPRLMEMIDGFLYGKNLNWLSEQKCYLDQLLW